MDKSVFFPKKIPEYLYAVFMSPSIDTGKKNHQVFIHGRYFQKNPNKYGYQISINLVSILGTEYPYSVSIYSGSYIYKYDGDVDIKVLFDI